jgi:hypothetical protein
LGRDSVLQGVGNFIFISHLRQKLERKDFKTEMTTKLLARKCELALLHENFNSMESHRGEMARKFKYEFTGKPDLKLEPNSKLTPKRCLLPAVLKSDDDIDGHLTCIQQGLSDAVR